MEIKIQTIAIIQGKAIKIFLDKSKFFVQKGAGVRFVAALADGERVVYGSATHGEFERRQQEIKRSS